MNPNSLKILILFYSRRSSTFNLARQVTRSIESMSGREAVVRIVPGISAVCEAVGKDVPDNGTPYVTAEDLKTCFGPTLGSPSYFGNMAAAMKYFIDGTIPRWLGAELADKPATVFTSTGNLHGGQESTLLTMMLPLLHHDAIISGVPFSEHALNYTQSGGTPYGASHVAGRDGKAALTPDEHETAFTQGKRLAEPAVKLASWHVYKAVWKGNAAFSDGPNPPFP